VQESNRGHRDESEGKQASEADVGRQGCHVASRVTDPNIHYFTSLTTSRGSQAPAGANTNLFRFALKPIFFW
jgi:hypothetical protein